MGVYRNGMDYVQDTKTDARQRAYVSRSSVANRWARKMLWFTALVWLFAVWQHRDLAPPVHDGMALISEVTVDLFNGADKARALLSQLFSSPSGTGGAPKFDPITQWLLDNRN